MPKTKVLSFEHNDLHEYDAAHRRGQNRVYCIAAYPKCSFSLIEMALGEYMKAPSFMWCNGRKNTVVIKLDCIFM